MLFAALALEWLTFEVLRRSTTRKQASPWVSVCAALPRVCGVGFGLILTSGVYLAARAGVYDLAWVRVSFGSMVLMGILGGPVARSRMRAIRSAGADERGVTDLRTQALNPLLGASVRTRVAVGLATVYLMIGKLDLGKSLLVTGAALALGAAIGVWQRRA